MYVGEIVKHRQQLAHQLGFESHAHKYLGNKVLKTPDKVRSHPPLSTSIYN